MLSDTDVEEILEAIESHYSGKLTDWETDFVHSIAEQWETRRTLTDKQRAKLSDIWDGFRTGRRT